jgi:hypothetical protein
VKNDELDLVEESAPSETKKETAYGVRADMGGPSHYWRYVPYWSERESE